MPLLYRFESDCSYIREVKIMYKRVPNPWVRPMLSLINRLNVLYQNLILVTYLLMKSCL